jgi:hypothetical protein
MGERVVVRDATGKVLASGTAAGVNDLGNLLICEHDSSDSPPVAIAAGEVTLAQTE